jgi:hypothetical protein
MKGETMEQHDHIAQMPLGQGSVSELGPLNDTVRYRSGILIFSRGQKLLHANRRALELTGHLHQAEVGTVGEIHSAPVRELRSAIQAAMDHRRAANIWEPFKLKRVIFEGRRKLLVSGFGLTDRSSHDDSRIVIVLDELGLRQARSEPERQVTGLSQERRGAAILGSTQLGSDRGVFDVGIYGAL